MGTGAGGATNPACGQPLKYHTATSLPRTMAPLLATLRGLSEFLRRHSLVDAPLADLRANVESFSQSAAQAKELSVEQRGPVIRQAAPSPPPPPVLPARQQYTISPSESRELERAGQLLGEQDGRLQALLLSSQPALLEDWVFRAAAAARALDFMLSLAAVHGLKADVEMSCAVALLRAACLLTGSGRLALAAAWQRGSSCSTLGAMRLHLLVSHLSAAGAAAAVFDQAGGPATLLTAAHAAFNPADTAEWLQLLTSRLLSLCLGGPLAATLGEGTWSLPVPPVHATTWDRALWLCHSNLVNCPRCMQASCSDTCDSMAPFVGCCFGQSSALSGRRLRSMPHCRCSWSGRWLSTACRQL